MSDDQYSPESAQKKRRTCPQLSIELSDDLSSLDDKSLLSDSFDETKEIESDDSDVGEYDQLEENSLRKRSSYPTDLEMLLYANHPFGAAGFICEGCQYQGK